MKKFFGFEESIFLFKFALDLKVVLKELTFSK
jgi:hypothetical protein